MIGHLEVGCQEGGIESIRKQMQSSNGVGQVNTVM